MTPNSKKKKAIHDSFFQEAWQDWDLERLINDLGIAGSSKEQCTLRSLLLGLPPKQAANKTGLQDDVMRGYYSNLYRLIENWTGADKVGLQSAALVLEKAGYRKNNISTHNENLVSPSKGKKETPNFISCLEQNQEIHQPPTEHEFIGRERDLTELESLTGKYKIVLIKAGAGVGKSTLAGFFLEKYFQRKPIEINLAISVDDNIPADQKLPSILKDLNQETYNSFDLNLACLKKRLLDKSQPPVAFLINNLESALDNNFRFLEKLSGYEALLEVLSDRNAYSFTLITSRLSLNAPRVKFYEYQLEGLDITAWQQYFQDYENVENSEALKEMRSAYNGNAKVMELLHRKIKRRFDGDIEYYWSLYENTLLDLTLETLISEEMNWLRNNQPDAYKLLCRMGCYRYQDVKTVPHKGMTELLWELDEPNKNRIVDYLSETSLIEHKKEYYLHPMIREAALLRLKEDPMDFKSANIKAAKMWTDIVKSIENTDDAFKAFEAYHHYCAAEEYQLAGDIIVRKRDNKWEPQEPLGTSMYRLGILGDLKTAVNKVIEYIDKSYNLSRIYNILGDVCWLIGNIKEAIISHEKSKEIAIALNLKGLEDVALKGLEAVAFFNIGLCYIELWEIELAMENFKKCIHLSRNKSYEYYTYTIDSYYCLSFLNSELGFKEESIDFANKALKEIHLLDKNTWSRGYSRLFLGKTFLKLGDQKESYKMYNEAQVYAEESHYSQVKANALHGFALIERKKKDFEKAIPLHYEAIKILKEIGANPDLAEAYFQLGLTYQAREEHEQVEKYKLKALKLFDQMEAEKQKDRVNKAFGENI
jgi:tetratricopeptide (TPR) repeat protein